VSLQKKSFVVFGGGSGLGRATAHALALKGAVVTVSDISANPLEIGAIGAGGVQGYVQADITDEAQVRRVLDAATADHGRIDGVVNTAGVVTGERVVGKQGAHSLQAFERVIRVNLIGAFNVLRLAAEAMSRSEPGESGQRGVIVNTASIAAYDGQIGQVAYAASKAGIVGMTLPAARDLARLGIRVVTIAPGMFATPMVNSLPAEVQDSLQRLVPFPARFGAPEEFAALVCHVLENQMLNGEVIRLDGALRMPPA
jgi:NAD(P)-dependent dehydrogenase (short-subunit alcohol dehydrogenase family)